MHSREELKTAVILCIKETKRCIILKTLCHFTQGCGKLLQQFILVFEVSDLEFCISHSCATFIRRLAHTTQRCSPHCLSVRLSVSLKCVGTLKQLPYMFLRTHFFLETINFSFKFFTYLVYLVQHLQGIFLLLNQHFDPWN